MEIIWLPGGGYKEMTCTKYYEEKCKDLKLLKYIREETPKKPDVNAHNITVDFSPQKVAQINIFINNKAANSTK